jgi:hypothetical protein
MQAMPGLRLFGLIGFGWVGFGGVGFDSRCLLGAGGHPGVVFGRTAPRWHAVRLAAHPLRQIRHPLARRFSAGARRERNAGEAKQGRFERWGARMHFAVVPPHCGDHTQSRLRCDQWPHGHSRTTWSRRRFQYRAVSEPGSKCNDRECRWRISGIMVSLYSPFRALTTA